MILSAETRIMDNISHCQDVDTVHDDTEHESHDDFLVESLVEGRSSSFNDSLIQSNNHDRLKRSISHLSERCIRNGIPRYAIKHLAFEDALEEECERARLDLAIEVTYLQVLSHPHIIKLRAVFECDDLLHPGFFFVMDRLSGTLEDKIKEWSEMRETAWKRLWLSIIDKRQQLEEKTDFLIERLLVAHDIASAFDYLHTNKVMHR